MPPSLSNLEFGYAGELLSASPSELAAKEAAWGRARYAAISQVYIVLATTSNIKIKGVP
jgi:hypothetical protein